MIIITRIIGTFVSCLHNTLLPGNSCSMGSAVNTAHNLFTCTSCFAQQINNVTPLIITKNMSMKAYQR